MGRRRASGAHSAKRRQSGERLALFRVSISACFSFFLSGLCVHIEDSFAGSPPPPCSGPRPDRFCSLPNALRSLLELAFACTSRSGRL